MCLRVEYRVHTPEVAKKDIRCYKVVQKGKTVYHTPYNSMMVEMGGKYETELGNVICHTVERGFHSFSSKRAATRELNFWRDGIEGVVNYVVVECIIPKGALYYEGEFSELKSYASNKINYIKIV